MVSGVGLRLWLGLVWSGMGSGGVAAGPSRISDVVVVVVVVVFAVAVAVAVIMGVGVGEIVVSPCVV